MVWGCASSVQVIQSGERPDPAKRSEQPVLSLGAEAARRGLSVGRGVREPQWETVKRYSLVRYKERKPIPSSRSQAARTTRKRKVGEIPSGSIERGERTKVVPVYLGDLTGSTRW